MLSTKTIIIRLLIILFGAIVGVAVGDLIEREFFDKVETIMSVSDKDITKGIIWGALSGAFVMIPIGYYATTKKRRWTLVSLMNLGLVLIGILGGLKSFGFAAVAVVLTYVVSAASLKELYKDNYIEAFKEHLQLVTGRTKGFQIIEDGRTILPKTNEDLLGPRLVIVRPGHAIITVRGSQQGRVAGPGTFLSDPFEIVKKIYVTSRIQNTIGVTGALTKDLVPLTIELTVVYGIDINQNVAYENNGFGKTKNTVTREQVVLQTIDRQIPDWETFLIANIKATTCDIVSDYPIKKFATAHSHSLLGETIMRASNARTRRRYHLVLDSVTVNKMHVEDAVTTAASAAYGDNIRTETWEKGQKKRKSYT